MNILLGLILVGIILLVSFSIGNAVQKVTYNLIKNEEPRQEFYINIEDNYERHAKSRKPNTRQLHRKRD